MNVASTLGTSRYLCVVVHNAGQDLDQNGSNNGKQQNKIILRKTATEYIRTETSRHQTKDYDGIHRKKDKYLPSERQLLEDDTKQFVKKNSCTALAN